jgi:hypothetical protein
VTLQLRLPNLRERSYTVTLDDGCADFAGERSAIALGKPWSTCSYLISMIQV